MQKTVPDNRRALILDEAAKLFSARGYDSTSMRDIAAAVGMLPGSIYYHFPSKDEILATIYGIGVDQIITAVETAIATVEDPWDRLEAAAVAHLDTLLNRDGYAAAVIADWPGDGEIRPRLVTERDRYETIFRKLVAALPGLRKAEQRLFRLTLLGALNWTLTWYRPGRQTPAQIARGIIAMLRKT
ncbi:MAG: TetR/AcrR family transcriptional regulator [Ferrovibrionaceae bacterium]